MTKILLERTYTASPLSVIRLLILAPSPTKKSFMSSGIWIYIAPSSVLHIRRRDRDTLQDIVFQILS